MQTQMLLPNKAMIDTNIKYKNTRTPWPLGATIAYDHTSCIVSVHRSY